jgi:hypothetical protein
MSAADFEENRHLRGYSLLNFLVALPILHEGWRRNTITRGAINTETAAKEIFRIMIPLVVDRVAIGTSGYTILSYVGIVNPL